MRNYYKVRRGFVFWYCLDKNVDKYRNPTISVGGKEYPDNRQHGKRMWLVTSCDACNVSSPVVTIVPITTQSSKTPLPTHVSFTFEGTALTILCEQPMSINKIELRDFACMLDDDVMKKVDKAIKVHYNLKDECMYADGEVGKALSRIEEVIDNIVREKISSTYSARQVDVDDYVLRVAEGLESLIGTKEKNGENISSKESVINNVPKDSKVESEDTEKVTVSSGTSPKKSTKTITSEMSAIEKFNSRYPGVCSNDNTFKQGKRRRGKSWSDERMKEFLSDCESMSTTQIMHKYGISSPKTVYQYKYSFKNKLGDK